MKNSVALVFLLVGIASIPTAYAWDPEEDMRRENERAGNRNRLCQLAHNNAQFKKFNPDTNMNPGGSESRLYVGEGKVVRYIIYGDNSRNCEIFPFNKKYFRHSCDSMWKKSGGKLVQYDKCPWNNYSTTKKVYLRAADAVRPAAPVKKPFCSSFDRLAGNC